MRTSLYSLVDGLETHVRLPTPIVEFGSRREPDQWRRPAVAERFGSKPYSGADLAQGPGVHQVQDLHSLGLRSESIGTALLLDTIEHVREPWTALREVHRCLKPGGFVVVTSVFLFPIHECPSDYWRFTAEAMSVLLKDFEFVHTGMASHADFPHTALGIGARAPLARCEWEETTAIADDWLHGAATSWKERMLVALPPSLVGRAYRSLRTAAETYHRYRAS